jgi:hypothetical protein
MAWYKNYLNYIGQGEARRRKYKRHKLGGGQEYNRSSDKLVLQTELPLIRHNLLYEPGLKEAQYLCCTYMNYRYNM